MNNLQNRIFERLHNFRNNTAVSHNNQSISYHELLTSSLSLARKINSKGISKSNVGVLCERSLDTYIHILAAVFSGNSFVPISLKANDERKKRIAKIANVSLILGTADAFTNFQLPKLENSIGYVPSNARCDEDIPNDKVFGVNDLPAYDNDIAYVMFTSGSTGAPKGIEISSSNLISFLDNLSTFYKLSPGFRASQTFDLSFDPAISDFFFTIMNGGQLCILNENELISPQDYIVREKINVWNSVPAIAKFLFDLGRLKPNTFVDLKYSSFCGESLPKYLADAWAVAAPNSTVENLYGPTEATIYICRFEHIPDGPTDRYKNDIVPIGKPLPNHDFQIIDDLGSCCSAGEVGELVVSGPQVSNGYLHEPLKTQESFCRFSWDSECKTWYRTGDLAMLNSRGELECLGRKDSQIKIAGRRIEIGEIEAVLRSFPSLDGTVVVALKNEEGTVKELVAFRTRELGASELSLIRRDSQKMLDREFFPRRFIFIEEIPASISGKIDRNALAQIAMAQSKLKG